jgi:hypothetical protein
MNHIPVLVEAKKEYTNQLQQILAPRLYEGLKSIYDDLLIALSNEMIENNVQNSSAIKTFQRSLKEIPLWNQDMIKNEYNRIEKLSKCDYFEKLLEAVFVTNTKILSSVQLNPNAQNVKINVPSSSHFVHKCYIECSKELYKNPYIFDMSRGLTPKERHSNLRESLNVINHSISNAVREMLPIREILEQGLLQEETQSTVSDEQLTEESINEDEDEDEDNNDQENKIELLKDNDVPTQELQHNEEFKTIHYDENANDEELLINIDDEEEENNDDNEEENNNDDEEGVGIPIYSNNEETKIIQLGGFENNTTAENVIENQINLLNINNDNIKHSLSDNNLNVNENSSEIKQINLEKPSLLRKINTIEKVESPNIAELMKPVMPKSININPKMQKINQKKFIKNKLMGGKNNAFYQKKYDQNLANYHYTSESYLDDDEAKNMTKNNINIDFNSSDEEDNSPVVLG